MRERLVIAFVGLTLAVIGLYGVPRAYFLADLVREREAATLEHTATLVAALVDERTAAGGSVDLDLLDDGLVAADSVEFVPDDGIGTLVTADGSVDEEGGIEATREVSGGTLRLTVSGDTVSKGIRDAITPLVLLGLALAVVSAALGLALARRLSRPFQDLAEYSRDLGHGRFDIDIPPYSVPEAEAIGASLRSAAGQLDDLVRREREFAANASHQLRTPITALRLSLEDLSLWPETPDPVRDELEHGLGELDRLSGAIDELLGLARGQRLEAHQDIDLAALVASAAARWRRQVDEQDRTLVVADTAPIPTRLAPGPVEQILDVLVDNARLHGRGTITIDTRDAGTHLEVAVGDEGERRIGPEVFRRGVTSRSVDGDGHGIGLAVASELAELCGGHLSLDTATPRTRFVLWLPHATG